MLLNKDHYWLTLTLLRLKALSRSHDTSMFCMEKCKQPEMLVSSKPVAQSLYIHLRIEIHILSLHWMMKTLAILMSVKPNALLGDTKIANVFHHPVQD